MEIIVNFGGRFLNIPDASVEVFALSSINEIAEAVLLESDWWKPAGPWRFYGIKSLVQKRRCWNFMSSDVNFREEKNISHHFPTVWNFVNQIWSFKSIGKINWVDFSW